MVGLLIVAFVALFGGWFAWLYFVSPPSDIERIKADQGGTGVQVVNVQRIGTQHDRADLTWVADHPTPRNGGRWLRIYRITAQGPGGMEAYTVGVEARLFGLSDLARIDRQT